MLRPVAEGGLTHQSELCDPEGALETGVLEAHGGMLVSLVSCADTEDETAVAHLIEAGRHPGEEDRMVEGERGH